MFNYEVTAYVNGDEVSLRTNNIHNAIEALFANDADGTHANIINGHTGEVLAIVNHPDGENFATDEMALMILGYMMGEVLAEHEDEPADEPHIVPADGAIADPAVALISSLFGVPADAVVALHNHADDEPAEETGSEMVLRMIAERGGLPS